METHEVKELLSQFDQSTLTELQLKKETFELYFNKNTTSGLQSASSAPASAPAANAAPTPVAPTPAVSATPDTVETAKPVLEGKEVVSPLVGVVYLSALTIQEIKEIIPHRYPMLLVDRVEELEEGKRVVAKKNVTINEPFFQGHFPHEPVMPGVLIVEAMAQAGAVALLSLEDFRGKTAYFGGLDKAKFRKKVTPGDTLILEVEIIKVKSAAGIGKGIAYVDGKKVAEAELTFMIG